MARRQLSTAGVALLACLSSGAFAAGVDFPSVPVPEGATGEIVTQHMTYNGLHMRASKFTARKPMAEVLAFYRKQWGKGMVETPARGKTIVGRLAEGYYITVELTPSGQVTLGQVGISQVPPKGSRPSRGKDFARLPRTAVIEDIVYMDTPEHARTLNMRNTYSPYQNDRFYARSFRARGYVRDPSSKPCGLASRQCMAYYIKDEQRVVLASVRDDRGTQVAAIIQ